MSYSTRKEVQKSYSDTIERVKETLADHNFGVLSEIDVSAKFKEKLGIEYDSYTIIGACNPTLAHEAIEEEKELGLLLPCNLIVYRDNGTTYVAIINATKELGITGNKDLQPIAEQVEADLKNVLKDL